MIRNLKVLGLALVAVFALSAVVASGASAQTVGKLTTATGQPVTLDMTELAGKTNALTAFGLLPLECPGSTLSGHKTITQAETAANPNLKHEAVPVNASTVTVTPNYVNCHAVNAAGTETHKATVTMNGCDYHFKVGETLNTNEYEVTADVECPAGKVIEAHIYPFAGSELGGSVCTITVASQTNLKGAAGAPVRLITDTVKDDLRVEGTFKGIHVTKHAGAGCPNEPNTTNEGEFHINVTVEGTKPTAPEKVGITVTH